MNIKIRIEDKGSSVSDRVSVHKCNVMLQWSETEWTQEITISGINSGVINCSIIKDLGKCKREQNLSYNL